MGHCYMNPVPHCLVSLADVMVTLIIVMKHILVCGVEVRGHSTALASSSSRAVTLYFLPVAIQRLSQ